MLTIPTARRYQLRNATIPADLAPGLSAPTTQGLAAADLVIADGLVESITPAGADLSLDASVDLRGGMVWPCFTDMHTHLDKGHIWERAPNPDGSFMGALETVRLKFTDTFARFGNLDDPSFAGLSDPLTGPFSSSGSGITMPSRMNEEDIPF